MSLPLLWKMSPGVIQAKQCPCSCQHEQRPPKCTKWEFLYRIILTHLIASFITSSRENRLAAPALLRLVWLHRFLPRMFYLLIKIQDTSFLFFFFLFSVHLSHYHQLCRSYFLTLEEDITEVTAIKNNFFQVPYLTKTPQPKPGQEVPFSQRHQCSWGFARFLHWAAHPVSPCCLVIGGRSFHPNHHHLFCVLRQGVAGSSTTAAPRNLVVSV